MQILNAMLPLFMFVCVFCTIVYVLWNAIPTANDEKRDEQ